MTMRQGTIVDATLIAGPSSTMNREGKRDPEMHQTKKGHQWYNGMKVHIGVDKGNGLIHSIETTATNVHGLTPAADFPHGKETLVYADAGYQGIEKREEMNGKALGFCVAILPGKRCALPDTLEGRLDDLIETAKAHIRAKGEHQFRVIWTKSVGGHSGSSAFRSQAAWPGQEQLQGQCAGSSREPVPGPHLLRCKT
jgi:IS5 family transposase